MYTNTGGNLSTNCGTFLIVPILVEILLPIGTFLIVPILVEIFLPIGAFLHDGTNTGPATPEREVSPMA